MLLPETIVFLLLISFTCERIIELIKLLLPKAQWDNQTHWKLFIGILSSVIGFLLAYTILPDLGFSNKLGQSILLGIGSGVGSKTIRDLVVKLKI
jgi:hypothetical protein